MEPPPSNKRSRPGEEHGPPRIVECEDLSFADGTIILRVYSPEKHIYNMFRVHKSILSTNSGVLSALFGPSRQTNLLESSSEKYDGLPVMDMQDNAKDLEDFLRALYIPGFLHLNCREGFPRLYAGVMRLAQKFDVPQLHAIFASEMCTCWPPTFEGAHARFKLRVMGMNGIMGHKNGRRGEENRGLDAGHAIRMAVDYCIPEVLPPIFFEMAMTYGVTTTMSGSDTESGDLDGLKIREARTLILGSAALRDRISSCFPLDMTQIPHYANNFSDCYDVARCRNRDLGHLWQDITEHMRNGVHPWALYDDDDVFDGYRVCSGCKNVLKGYVRFYMEQTWPLLPQLFKLGDYGVRPGWPHD